MPTTRSGSVAPRTHPSDSEDDLRSQRSGGDTITGTNRQRPTVEASLAQLNELMAQMLDSQNKLLTRFLESERFASLESPARKETSLTDARSAASKTSQERCDEAAERWAAGNPNHRRTRRSEDRDYEEHQEATGFSSVKAECSWDGDADDLEDFLDTAEKIFDMNRNRLSERQKVNFAIVATSGRPRKFIHKHQRSGNDAEWKEDWEEFKHFLRVNYGDLNPEETAFQDLWNLRQTGTVRNYNADFKALAVEVPTDKATLKHRYNKGLKEDIRKRLHTYSHLSLERFMAEALRMERADHPYTPKDSTRERRSEGRSGHRDHRDDRKRIDEPRLSLKHREHARPLAPAYNLSREAREVRRSKGLCFTCGEAGHGFANCPKKSEARPLKANAVGMSSDGKLLLGGEPDEETNLEDYPDSSLSDTSSEDSPSGKESENELPARR